MLSQLLCVPTVRIEKSGSVRVSHNDSADAIFIGCCTNINLPWASPVKSKPTVATSATQHPRMVAGRNMVRASDSAAGVAVSGLRERTNHHALTAATKVPAVSKEPATACEKAALAVLLVNNAAMLVNSARRVAGL